MNDIIDQIDFDESFNYHARKNLRRIGRRVLHLRLGMEERSSIPTVIFLVSSKS